MTARLRVLIEQPTRGKRWVAVAADWSRKGWQDGGRGGREARPLRAAIPPDREARPAGLRARGPDRRRDHRPVHGGRIDRLLGHLVRALAARPQAVRREALRAQRAAPTRRLGRAGRDRRPRLGGAPAGRQGRRALPRPPRSARPWGPGGRPLGARPGAVPAEGPTDGPRDPPSPRPPRRPDARL